MDILLYILLLAAPGFLIFYTIKQGKYNESASQFTQARVTIDYTNQTITIKGRSYHVDKVTGIQIQAFRSERRGNSKSKNVVIEIEDISKPVHKINFLSRRQAEKFMQRVCVALRKAGGPSFI